VKFIAFWEFSREDTDKLIPKFQKWLEALKKNPEKHIKTIFPPHYLSAVNEKGNPNGVTIFECDDEEKLIDFIQSYWPEMKIRIVPLMDAGKTMEINLKMRK
jgi:hypothetical protein